MHRHDVELEGVVLAVGVGTQSLIALAAAVGALVLGTPRVRDRLATNLNEKRRAMGLPTSYRSQHLALTAMAVMLALIAAWGFIAVLS